MNAHPSPFSILPLIVMGLWATIQLVKQSLWTLREAGTKEGRWNNQRLFDLRDRKDDSGSFEARCLSCSIALREPVAAGHSI